MCRARRTYRALHATVRGSMAKNKTTTTVGAARKSAITGSRNAASDMHQVRIQRIKERLEYLRAELRAERISCGELAELQGLADHIDNNDVELLEAAGIPEGIREADDTARSVPSTNREQTIVDCECHRDDGLECPVCGTIVVTFHTFNSAECPKCETELVLDDSGQLLLVQLRRDLAALVKGGLR